MYCELSRLSDARVQIQKYLRHVLLVVAWICSECQNTMDVDRMNNRSLCNNSAMGICVIYRREGEKDKTILADNRLAYVQFDSQKTNEYLFVSNWYCTFYSEPQLNVYCCGRFRQINIEYRFSFGFLSMIGRRHGDLNIVRRLAVDTTKRKRLKSSAILNQPDRDHEENRGRERGRSNPKSNQNFLRLFLGSELNLRICSVLFFLSRT